MAIRDICGDWAKGVNPAEDPVLKGKKDSDTGYLINIGNKTTVPSATQVSLAWRVGLAVLKIRQLFSVIDNFDFMAVGYFESCTYFIFIRCRRS